MHVPPFSPSLRLDGAARAAYVAMHVLDRVDEGHEAAFVLARAGKRARLTPEEAAAAVRYAYAVLKGRNRFDWLLEQGGVSVEPWSRPGWRLAASLAESSESTEPAEIALRALARSVERQFDGRQWRGFVAFAAKPRFPDGAEGLALKFGHPSWLVEMWTRELGTQTPALLAANNQEPRLSIRANRLKTDPADLAAQLSKEGFRAKPGAFAPDALFVEPKQGIFRTQAFRTGLFEVQDEGSQLVVALVGAKSGQTVLDACAGAGGKTLALGASMANKGTVVALDTNAGRLDDLKGRAGRAGVFNYEAILVDPQSEPVASAKDLRRGVEKPRAPKLPVSFDAILIDAPCSGLGALRRTPEIRWRRGPDQIAHYPVIQSALLVRWAPHVKPAGALVYATCTLRRAENDEVVEPFLASHPEFALGDAREALPETARHVVDARGFLRTMPHRDGCDGFFAARMVRA
ncbi:MAG TPA: class I SAM-dependent methyltransferase [Thermoanaerobaculia bacterium]|nr:class I SAM-dependent methyltransferase [Thermoanaerobaculia bacterium]